MFSPQRLWDRLALPCLLARGRHAAFLIACILTGSCEQTSDKSVTPRKELAARSKFSQAQAGWVDTPVWPAACSPSTSMQRNGSGPGIIYAQQTPLRNQNIRYEVKGRATYA